MSYVVDAQKNSNIETFKLPLAKSLRGAQCLSSVPPAEYVVYITFMVGLEMIRWDMRRVLSAGVLYKVWRKYYSQLSVC